MADRVILKLEGAKEMADMFRELRGSMQQKYAAPAVRKAARRYLTALQSVTPISGGLSGTSFKRGRSKDPGRLRRNMFLKTTAGKRSVGANIALRVSGAKDSASNAYYWTFVEYPHRVRTGSKWGSDSATYMQKKDRNSRSSKVYQGPTVDVKGRYFIRDTFKTYARMSSQMVADAITRAMDRALAKQRRSAK